MLMSYMYESDLHRRVHISAVHTRYHVALPLLMTKHVIEASKLSSAHSYSQCGDNAKLSPA